MAGPKSVLAWICSGILISLILPVIGTVVAEVMLPAFFFAHLPLHSLIEAAGGIIALAVAGILRAEMLRKEGTAYYRWMILALIGMGVLDLFHAASHPGVHFVWLHSLATFVGGVLFALVWVNAHGPKFITSLRFQLTYVVLFALVGMTSILRAEILPTMTATSNQQFSTIALTLNFVGGVGFLVAAAFFIKRFFAMTKFEDWLFAVHTTLFGVAGVLFAYSVLWDGSWWWWHVLRLAAFTIALVYGLKIFHDAQIEMQLVNFRLNESNAALDRTVAERTAKLLQSEERFQLAVRGSTDGIWDWNVLTNEVYYSPRFKELIGYSDEEFPNVFSSFESRLHSEDHDSTLQRVNEHLTKQRPYDVEYRLLTKSGEYRWFRARGQAIWSSNGQPERMAGSITDITEEHLLRERFRLAVEASPAALLMLDQSGIILMANSRSATLFGYENGELIGQSAEILLTTKLRREYPNHRDHFFEDLRLQAMGAELDLLAVRKDGTNFPAKVGLSPVATAGGQAVICGVMDITHQVIALDTMRQAKEQAESASRAKSSFLANMSHEIRTPMNGIIGMVQLLSQTDLRSNQRDYLATVDESAHVLLRLLNDILDFSKIEAGKLELECVEFRLSECVTRTTQLLLLRAAEKGLEIACRIAPDVPDYLRGDCGRLQQVLVNLIGNAIKFTEAGEIVVNIFTVFSLSNSHVRLQISISDTGIGIPQGKLDEIFHPFEQAESSTTRRFGGTGLGLAISKQLVSMMDGRLWVESEFGKGSTFHFTVQVQVSPDQHLREPAELASLKGLTVLIIDDNATNRRFLKEIAEYWDMHPILADSAAAARTILEETSGSGSQMPIQLILLDHHMPAEDGFKFAESLRQLPTPVRCPIFMISSGGISADSEDMRKLGIERFMTKPVIASDLLNKLLELFGRSGKPTPPVSSVTDLATTAPRRILLVEDNEINRRVASAMLRSRGHQVIMLENGQEAVDILANEEFDVVLMDMQMPIMDGYLATAEIRKREKKTGGHIPIVAMTAEALKGDREHCLASGMDDYVSKPILQVELFRAVERFPAVCLDATRSSPVEKAIQCTIATQPPIRESQSNSAAPAQSKAMDWNLAKERLPGGPAMMKEFMDLFKKDCPDRILDIRRAIENRDAELLRRSSHTLKSNLNYFGATMAAELALSLETLGRNKSFDQAESLFAALEIEFARVLDEMNRSNELMQ